MRKGTVVSAHALLAIILASSVTAPNVHAAVFGPDERRVMPLRHKPLARSIALLFNIKSKTVCSAFCVADNVIATAGHCLFKTAGEQPLDPNDFHFGQPNARAGEFARVAGSQNGTAAQNVRAGTMRLSTKPPIDAAQDWALLRLDRPACRGAVLPVRPMPSTEIVIQAAAGQIFQAAFHRDRLPWKLAYAGPCNVAPTFDQVERRQIENDFRTPERLLLHRCDTAGASSGSPLLLDTPSGPVVIGINVGTYVQSRIAVEDGAVLFRSKPEPIANTAVNASAFASQIAEFAAFPNRQDLVSRSSRITSSAESGTGGTSAAAGVRHLRASSNPANASSNIGVAQSRSVDRSTGGRNSTNVP